MSVAEELHQFDLAKLGRLGIKTFHLPSRTAGRQAHKPGASGTEAKVLELFGPLGLAPGLVDADPNGDWLIERLIEGTDLRFAPREVDESSLGAVLADILLPMWSHASNQSIDRDYYVRAIGEPILRAVATQNPSDDGARIDIERLVDIASAAPTTIPLVWSHGDLVRKNIIRRTCGRLAAIDWEHARMRSPALDAYGFSLHALDLGLPAEPMARRTGPSIHALTLGHARPQVQELAPLFDSPSAAFAIAGLELIGRDVGDDQNELDPHTAKLIGGITDLAAELRRQAS